MASPITAFPAFNLLFQLSMDISQAILVLTLTQVQDLKKWIICCASKVVKQAKKNYPSTKVPLVPDGQAVWTLHKPLCSSVVEVMRTRSALLHCLSAALEDYQFTVRHRPSKSQADVDGLNHFPTNPPPLPDKAALHMSPLPDIEPAWIAVRSPHAATHLEDEAPWKLFWDCYEYKVGKRIRFKITHSCSQCQVGSDFYLCKKTTGIITSAEQFDMQIIGWSLSFCQSTTIPHTLSSADCSILLERVILILESPATCSPIQAKNSPARYGLNC